MFLDYFCVATVALVLLIISACTVLLTKVSHE